MPIQLKLKPLFILLCSVGTGVVVLTVLQSAVRVVTQKIRKTFSDFVRQERIPTTNQQQAVQHQQDIKTSREKTIEHSVISFWCCKFHTPTTRRQPDTKRRTSESPSVGSALYFVRSIPGAYQHTRTQQQQQHGEDKKTW